MLVLASMLAGGALAYHTLSRQLDTHLSDGWSPAPAELFASELEIWQGMLLDPEELARLLDESGYKRRDRARGAGEFSVEPAAVTFLEQSGPRRGRTLVVRFERDAADETHIAGIEVPPETIIDHVQLGAPLLSTRSREARAKRRIVPLQEIPDSVVQAILAAEDARFFDHAGIDPRRIAGAAVTNLSGERNTLVGASTLTQQLIKNALLTPEKTFTRKLHEQALAMLLERRLPKTRILELYLNGVYLGQHGSFATHGVAQGARALFGKDLDNLTLGEAATMAGIIQAPQTHNPGRHPERARAGRNGVLQAMVDLDFITPDAALAAAREPIGPPPLLPDVEAPYFTDLVARRLAPLTPAGAEGIRVDTTLDLHLQRVAEASVRRGLIRIGERTAAGASSPAQAALVAVDLRNGAIRALVGGGSYLDSQFNRAERARRQPGSIVKPFVYLAAIERARTDPNFTFTPATLIDDAPATFVHDNRRWRPTNFGHVYDGPITARMALARSRNVATVKVAEQAGFNAIAELWAAASDGPVPPAYPSLALGAFEVTPLEVAAAYATLANGGQRLPVHAIRRVTTGQGTPIQIPVGAQRRVAAADSAYLVTRMLHSTFDDGTAVSARRQGFHRTASGKTGTTDDLRDAWFAGFTETLLAVVWVGRDDGSPLGLTGADAALPIWTDFMRRAEAGRSSAGGRPPAKVTLVTIDPRSGRRATERCPEQLEEVFRQGTEPRAICHLH